MNHGIIGNCNTCALVSKDASIDWFCYPTFSSPSMFGRILDEEKGGEFSIKSKEPATVEQSYIKNTNIIETIYTIKGAKFRIIDFMPRYKLLLEGKNRIAKGNQIIRIVEPIKGSPEIIVRFNPKPDYARQEAIMEEREKSILLKAGTDELMLISNLGMKPISGDQHFKLDRTAFFVFGIAEKPEWFTIRRVKKLFSATKRYWTSWVSSMVLPVANRDQIIRSALVLKLLTFSKTGAIIAAATTSIPEEIGSSRCFDYRFCWVRDSAYAVDALSKIGKLRDAKKFMDFIMERVMNDDHLQIMYGIHGETKLTEEELGHLSGYQNSRPVRVGNAAYNQDQHDVYGELIDVMYLYYVYYDFEQEIPKKYWRFLEWLVNQIKFNWDKRDSGIWEFRNNMLHYTYSKLMCWVGVDRAIKIAQKFGKDTLANKWITLKQDIRSDLLKHGYNEQLHSFTMYYGSKELDASLLHMTYHEFLEPGDPRMINTVKSIYSDLRNDHLVQRYKVQDDFGVSKSAFTICTFWLIDSLIYIGEIDKAREIYDKIVKCSNHLGLFSEDIDIVTGALTGNFPQAYTHIAMINTSILLSEWSSKRKKIDWTTVGRSNWF